MKYFVGIDIGSTAIKIAVLNDDKNICALGQSPTGSRFNQNTSDTLDRLFAENQLDSSLISYTVTTGYGRKLFKTGDENINELTANVEGAIFMAPAGSNIRTIINIGGQDTKIIQLDQHNQMTNFIMNDKCAAGTGRFLDIAARNLEVDVDELKELHFKALDKPLSINSTCAVFAESEIISLLAAGHNTSEIACGIHYSIAKRIARLATRIQLNDDILFDGGPALNSGMVDAIENELMRKVIVQPHPQFTTAIGASVYARKQYDFESKSVIQN
ncbi:MAG: CoA activase [Bacteroidetes bacterium]|nr:CoA activase [Bacteroidota bacterium]MBU1580148.1 CoA activase [Bacteroidota bacterium]MBU2558873.1 CoA activase [Bacteroidota bacterium]